MRTFRILLLTVSVMWVTFSAQGQQLSKCIAANEAPAGHWMVNCGFSVTADADSVAKLKAYIFDPAVGRVVQSVLTDFSSDGFDLDVQEDLDKDRSYFVFADEVTFSGKPPDAILSSKLGFKASAGGGSGGGGSNPRWRTYFTKIVAAPNKDKSDLYFDGSVWTVAGQDWNWAGSVDLKVQIPFRIGRTRFDHQISPFVTLQSSNDPSADPDSLKYGANWSARLFGIHGWFKGLFGKEELRIESTRDFTDENFISDTRFTLELPSLVPRKKSFHGFIEPFGGVETGKNIKSPLATVDGSGRARPLAGLSFSLTFTKVPRLKAISITSDLIRRWPLETELGFKADSNNVLQLTSVGTAPKDHAVSKINFMLNDLLGFSFGHEYGSEPPEFKSVDNKLTVSLLFQAKFGSSK